MIHLRFYPAEIAQAADGGHNVGAYIRAGTDGDLIPSETIDSKEWLNVAAAMHAGDGVALDQTAGALHVFVDGGDFTVDVDLDGVYNVSTNADPDNVGIISHERAASPADANQTFRSTGGPLDAGSGLTPANIHSIDTAAYLHAYDGSDSWDRLTVDSGNLNVDLAAVSVVGGIPVDDTADTAIVTGAIVGSATEVKTVATPLANRKWLWLQNEDNKTVNIGPTGVTFDAAWAMHPGERIFMRAGPSVDVYLIGDTGTSALDNRYLELS